MESIETYRPLLFGIAYRMLGSAMEAEDMVQEAYLRSRDVPAGTIQNPKAYLCKIVTHLCLDQLKSARARREAYTGVWLPEPILSDDLIAQEKSDPYTLSMAFLILLESLSPAERAVFVLHEVFDYSYSEVAEMVGKDEQACRQLFHRAKQHLDKHERRFRSTPEAQYRLLNQFTAAAASGDLQGLANLLTENVTWWSDGGGKAVAAKRPVIGQDQVARLVKGLPKQARGEVTGAVANINGQPGLVFYIDGKLYSVLLLELEDEKISGIWFVNNPDKLHSVGAASVAPAGPVDPSADLRVTR